MKATLQTTLLNQLTPNKIKSMQSQGYNMYMTPHIGNKWRSDMASVLYMDIPHKTVEVNQSVKDILDLPDAIVRDGKTYNIVNETTPTLTPYLSLSTSKLTEYNLEDMLIYGETPAQIHYNSTKELLGEQNIALSYSLYASQQTQRLIAELLSTDIPLFDRYVSASGKVEKRIYFLDSVSAQQEIIETYNTLHTNITTTITSKKSTTLGDGPLMTNAAHIALDAVMSFIQQQALNVLDRDNPIAYMVSGSEMARYTKDPIIQQAILQVYEACCLIIPELPKNITLGMIPASTLEFLPQTHEILLIEMIQTICTLYNNLTSLKEQIKDYVRSVGNLPSTLCTQRDQTNRELEALKKLFKQENAKRSSFSQYDALQTGSRLAIIPEVGTLSFKELQLLFT